MQSKNCVIIFKSNGKIQYTQFSSRLKLIITCCKIAYLEYSNIDSLIKYLNFENNSSTDQLP